MEVILTRKRSLTVLAVLFVLSIASIVYSFSISPLEQSDYVVTLDTLVTPLAVQQPSQFPWRAQSGVLQRRDGFGNWSNYTGNMNQLFNDYEIATVADVAGIVPAIGTFPYTFNMRTTSQSTNTTSYSVSSLADLLGTYFREISYSIVATPNGQMLTADGTIQGYTTTKSLSIVLLNGFMGLSRNLLSLQSSITDDLTGDSRYNFYSNDGTYTSVTNLLQGLSSVNNLLRSGLYNPIGGSVLMPDGSVQDVAYSSVELVSRYGFAGLADILRGDLGTQGAPMTFIDYRTGQAEATYRYPSLFEINSAGFSEIQNLLALYLFSHGTDLDIKERENMQEQANTFVDEFTDPNGNGTPSTGNIKDAAGVSSGLKDAFSSSATAADAFNQLTSDENYSFFSSEVQNSLNPFYSARFYSRTDDDFTDYVHPKLDEILGGLGSSW